MVLSLHLQLEQMAALVSLSPYHSARQFKAATGLPPHQFLITRRVERAQQILRGRGTSVWPRSRSVSASQTKASSVFTSNGSLASPQGDFGPAQKAPKT